MNQPGHSLNLPRSLVDAELPDSVSQLIRLRWLAGLGVIVVTLLVGPVFDVVAPTRQLLTVGVFILVYNLAFYLSDRRQRRIVYQSDPYYWLAVGQMILDWIATTLLIHYSGGIESPAIYFFLFHIVIASIFFQPRTAYAFSAFALFLLCSVAVLEYYAIIPHFAIVGILIFPLYTNLLYSLGVLVFFGCTAIFITYLVTNISVNLRRRSVEVVELSESLQQLSDRLQVLNDSARTFNSTLELAEVLNLLVKKIAEVMDVRACSIRLLDKSEQRLEAVAVYGLSQAYLDKGPLVLENSPLDLQVLKGKTVNIPDVGQESSLLQYPTWPALEGIVSMLSAPLIGKNKALGTLRVYSEEKNHFTSEDETFLNAIAAQGSIAIENALAYQAIESLEATKSTFVRTFTHELRSPVGVIHSLLRNITDGYAGEITPLQRDLLERAVRRTDFLQELIDDLLDLSAGKVQVKSTVLLEELSLNDVLMKVFKRFEIPAQEKGLEFQWESEDSVEEVLVLANAEGLDRIFNNLISNAIKYTPRGGKVRVSLSKEGEEGIVSVEDSGIGIPEDAIPHLFSEFYRAPNAKEVESKGTGLGLVIVKDTVALFGGRVDVQSKLGVGSRFMVSFPRVEKIDKREPEVEELEGDKTG
jgi:signal transduction histidine kinase